MEDDVKRFNAWFPAEIMAELDRLAEKHNVKKTHLVIDAIKKYEANKQLDNLPAELLDLLRSVAKTTEKLDDKLDVIMALLAKSSK